MLLTTGYVLIQLVHVRWGFLHTFRCAFFKKKIKKIKRLMFLSLGWHVLKFKDSRQDVLWQCFLRNASLLQAKVVIYSLWQPSRPNKSKVIGKFEKTTPCSCKQLTLE